ncbi:MAG TPA: hypothetical protein VJS92_13755 [Candidatus Polarisedimenticolaceae bacterium]|nr:hypothetical protein [Candidatus Polarisedimenticolaceae bacterium]
MERAFGLVLILGFDALVLALGGFLIVGTLVMLGQVLRAGVRRLR